MPEDNDLNNLNVDEVLNIYNDTLEGPDYVIGGACSSVSKKAYDSGMSGIDGGHKV